MATRDPYSSGSHAPGTSGGYAATGTGRGGQQGTASTTERAEQVARETAERAKSKVGEAAEQAREQARSRMGGQLSRAGDELGTVAKAVSQVSEQLRQQDQTGLAQVADQTANQINRLAGYLRDAEIDDVMNDVQRFARQQPALFLGGAFALGVLAARFIKSSAPERPPRYGATDRYGYRTGDFYRSGYRPPGYGTGYRSGYTPGARGAMPVGAGAASRGYGTSSGMSGSTGSSFDRAMSGRQASGTPSGSRGSSLPGQTPAVHTAADPLTRHTPSTTPGTPPPGGTTPSSGAPLGGSLGQSGSPPTNPSASGTDTPGTPWARPTGQPPVRSDSDPSGGSSGSAESPRERGER